MIGFKTTDNYTFDERANWIKRNFGFLIRNSTLRHPITNFVLYLLLIVSFVGMFLFIPFLIRSYQLIESDGWSFINAYGKGFIPGWLIWVVIFIGILSLIRRKKFGLSILIIGYILVCIPLICNEFFEFICFSTPVLLGSIVLWGIMHLKKNGLSAWLWCADIPKTLLYVQNVFIALWIFMVMALPFIAAFSVGFNKNLYSNGMRVLDANLNSSPYYSMELYKEILMGDDFPYDLSLREEKSQDYLLKAEELCNTEANWDWVNQFNPSLLFLNSLIGVYKTEGESSAKEYIAREFMGIDFRYVKEVLNDDSSINYRYYKPVSSEILNLIEQMEEIMNNSIISESDC